MYGKEGDTTEKFEAIYDKDGNLLSSMEHLKDIELPAEVRNAVAKEYPGWTIEKDTYKMNHYKGKDKKERYKIVLKNGKDKKKVYTDANGKFLENHVL